MTLRILLEGEEEYGGDFEEWPTTRPQEFSDVAAAVIDDMGRSRSAAHVHHRLARHRRRGVTVRTLEEPRHSGMFGGPAPDALMVLIKLLATLIDDNGDAAIDGSPDRLAGAEYPAGRVPRVAGVLPGVPLVGTDSIASTLYLLAVGHVVGLDAPDVDRPERDHPRGPGEDQCPDPAGRRQPIGRPRPWHVTSPSTRPGGITVEFDADDPANGTIVRTGGPAYDAFRRP